MTTLQPASVPDDVRRRGGRAWIRALVFFLPALAVLAAASWARAFEAQLSAVLIHVFLSTKTNVVDTIVLSGLGTRAAFGMNISTACSVVLLVAPLLLVAALMAGTGRGRFRILIPAVLIATVALILLNQARFVIIAAMTLSGGMSAFGWAHTVVGSVLMIVGLVGVLVVFVRVVSRGGVQKP